MEFLYYVLTLILLLAAAFLMWFFIYGRRELRGGQRKEYPASLLLSLLSALVMVYDLRMALSVLEQYGDRAFLNLLFYPVSALALVMLLFPACFVFSRREAIVPGIANLVSAFLFMLLLNLLCFGFLKDHSDVSAGLGFLVTALLCYVTVINTPQLSRDRYKAELQKIDSELSEARNTYYEAVKKSSQEIRRSRHDMKNHLIALRELAQQSRREELLAYIDTIAEQIEAAAPPFRSGNDIADFIIADKYAKAEKRGLKLVLSGNLAGLSIEAADLVTILSNLLDNAIEAVSRLYGRDLSDEDKKIVLDFKKNANFILMTQTNKSPAKLDPLRIVSAKDSPDHGFGIMNIRRTVKKYGGEYNINCREEDGLYLVETEIMLPLIKD
ncbi:MAG: GHKL domain-containing protein [Lachnospiraceae bacterium]|nr:GHKL domain-containing protein [Lachnospiraceae bacterium]